jgi:hypothetical protein
MRLASRPRAGAASGNQYRSAGCLRGLPGRGTDMTISRQANAAATALKIRRTRAAKRAADLAPIVAELRAAGVTSLRSVAAALNERGIPTLSGRGEWHADTVRQLLARMGECATMARATRRQAKASEAGCRAHAENADARAAALAPTFAEIRASGITTLKGIARALNARNVPTPSGRKTWQAVQVRRVMARIA